MRLLLVQESPALADPETNLTRIDEIMHSAAACNVDIAIFPEMFLTGYNIGAQAGELAQAPDGSYEQALRESAANSGVAMVLGMPERQGNVVRNIALAIDQDGSVAARYAKIQLFGPDEQAVFAPGNQVMTARLAGRDVGLAICYDIEFPEFGRALAEKEVDIVLVPTANMVPFYEVPTTMIRARALENGMAIAYVNLVGIENGMEFMGQSCLVGPDGKDIARAGPDAAFLIADVEPALERARKTPTTTQRQDLLKSVLSPLA